MCWAGWLGVVTATAALIVVLEEAAPQSLSFFVGLTRLHAKRYDMPTWHTCKLSFEAILHQYFATRLSLV